MAEFVFHDGQKPHALRQAHIIQTWGDPRGKGWLHWPYGDMERYTAALNIYEVCRSWQRTDTENQGDWMQKNQAAWESIISPLMARDMADGKSQPWL